MLFNEKLRQLRRSKAMTQEEVAVALGVSTRAYQNYEAGKAYPKQSEVYRRISETFGVTADYMLSDEDRYVVAANERGGPGAKRDVQMLVAEVGGLFAGGELSEDDKDDVMRVLNNLYWNAKELNKKKYTPKKYRGAAADVSAK
jgi:transcriptional regulator with XRE-family HTH domain